MALQRFPITNVDDIVGAYRDPAEKLYASLELNQVGFPKTGMVVSQTPLGAAFTKANPCENGMWVVADKAAGAINPPAAATDSPIGIVYTTEKEYDYMHYGLQRFGRKIAGDYPRVGILGLGDTVTTNCLCYDDSENGFKATGEGASAKTAEENMLETVAAYATTPVYVVVAANSAVPQLTKTDPEGVGTYGKVVKFYTVPNGGIGVKYQIVHLA